MPSNIITSYLDSKRTFVATPLVSAHVGVSYLMVPFRPAREEAARVSADAVTTDSAVPLPDVPQAKLTGGARCKGGPE